MLRRFYTVMIVPHEGGTLRRLSVSLNFVVTMVGIFLFCFASSAFLSQFFLGAMHPVGNDENLLAEKQRLEKKLVEAQVLLQETCTTLDLYMEKQDCLDRANGTAEGDEDAMGGEVVEVEGRGHLFTADGDWYSTAKSVLDKADWRLQRMDERMCELHADPVPVPSRDFFWPVEGRITSRFGMRRDPFDGSRQFHEGVDIAAAARSEVVAVASGTVLEARRHGGYGNMVLVDHGDGRKTLYGHLHKYVVGPGQQVQRGQVIGTVGSTGRSTGPHLHFEIIENDRSVDPEKRRG